MGRRQIKQEVITHELWLGKTKTPNKTTGYDLVMVYEATWCPIMDCEGGGWLSPSDVFGWTFRYRAKHKSTFVTMCEGNREPLQSLIKQAVAELRDRYRMVDAS